MTKDDRSAADVLNALLKFSRNSTGKVEHRGDNLNGFFCEVAEFFMGHVHKEELARRISNHIASQVEAKNPLDDRTLEQIKILIVFLNSLYERHFSRAFLSIDTSWVVQLIASNGCTDPIVFKFLADVLVLTFGAREPGGTDDADDADDADGTDGTLQLLLLLLRCIRGRVEADVRENKENLLFCRRVERWLRWQGGLASSLGGTDEVDEVDEADEADKGGAPDEAPLRGGLPYEELLRGGKFHFRALCHLFALVAEKVGRKVTDGDEARSPDVGRTGHAGRPGHSKQSGQGYMGGSGERGERTAIWGLPQVKSLARDILHLLPFVSNPPMRDVIIKDLCYTAKEYLFPRREMEEVCLEVTRRMFFCVGNDPGGELGAPHGGEGVAVEGEAGGEKEVEVEGAEVEGEVEGDVEGDVEEGEEAELGVDAEPAGATGQEATPLLRTYLAYNANCYAKEGRETDAELLSDVYSFQVLYRDYLYEGDFLAKANLDDVRFFLLLLNRAYTSESVMKKVIFLFDGIVGAVDGMASAVVGIVGAVEGVARRKGRGKPHQGGGQFAEAWELYKCILRCVQNFSVHLLKENWHKMVGLLQVASSIRRRYEAGWSPRGLRRRSPKGSPKRSSRPPDEWHANRGSTHRSALPSEGANRGSTAADTPAPFDDLDYYIFKCCAGSDVGKGEMKVLQLLDFLLLRQVELLIWLLLRHSNGTVTRFALCQLVSRGDMGWKAVAKGVANKAANGEAVVVAGEKAPPPDGALDVQTLLDCMSDTFLFHVFFDECIRPTLFIKGDIPFYEFRLKNLIVAKVLKRNSLLMAKHFLVGLHGVRFFHVNIRVVLEGLLEALRLLGGGSPARTSSTDHSDCRVTRRSDCRLTCRLTCRSTCRVTDLHEVLGGIVKNVKNIPVSRRSDTLTLLLETAVRMNHHVGIFRRVKSYCVFLDAFEDEFFCKQMGLFYSLLRLNVGCMTEQSGGDITQEGGAFILMKNPTSDAFLSRFIGHLNHILLSNQHVYFWGYLRFFILLATHAELKNGSLILLRGGTGGEADELVNRFLFYILKYGAGNLFDEDSLEGVMTGLLARVGGCLFGEGVNSTRDGVNSTRDGVNSTRDGVNPAFEGLNSTREGGEAQTGRPCENHQQGDIPLRELLPFVDALEYLLPNSTTPFAECLSYYNRDYAGETERGASSHSRVPGGTLQKGLSPLPSNHKMTQPNGRFLLQVKALHDECVKYVTHFAERGIHEDATKIILAVSFLSSACSLFSPPRDAVPIEVVIHLQVGQASCGVPTEGRSKGKEKNPNGRTNLYGNKQYEVFNYYKYKYAYKSMCRGASERASSPFGGDVLSFAEKVISDIELCKGELVYVYMIVRRFVIPAVFGGTASGASGPVRGSGSTVRESGSSVRGNDTPSGNPQGADERTHILTLLLKQSDILIDRCCACKYPARILELLFLTLFHPLVVKHDIASHAGKGSWVATRGSEAECNSDDPPQKRADPTANHNRAANKTSGERPSLLLSYINKIMQYGQTKLSIIRSAVIPFLSSFIFSLIQNEDILQVSSEYLEELVEVVVDILICKEFVLEDLKRSFVNDHYKMKRGSILLHHFINEQICFHFFSRLENNEEVVLPADFFRVRHLPIFLRLLALMFLINLFGLLEGGGDGGKIGSTSYSDDVVQLAALQRRTLVRRLYARLLLQIMSRVSNKSVAASGGPPTGGAPSGAPLPSSSGHNTQLRGLQALCCLAKYFKCLKKTQRKLLILRVNQLLRDDHLSNTRQYLELFCLSVSPSSFVLLYPHLRRNLADGNTNTQLTVSTLIICAYILLKTKFSYYSFEELHINPSFARVCLSSGKFRMSQVVARQTGAPYLEGRKKNKQNRKRRSKEDSREIKRIINKIVKRNQNDKEKIVQDVRRCGKKVARLGRRTGGKEAEGVSQRGDPHKERTAKRGDAHKEGVSPPRRGLFFSEHIRKCLVALVTRIVALCSSHAALVRSIAQYTFYYFVKGRQELLSDPFFHCTYWYIKKNKDCKRIRRKMKEQFRHWTPAPFEDIRILLPACNYSYSYFDEDVANEEGTNTFAHVLRNYELVSSYTFIETLRRAVQQEMSAIMFSVDLERQRREAAKALAVKAVDVLAVDALAVDAVNASDSGCAPPLEAALQRNKKNYQQKFDPVNDLFQVNNEFRRTYHQLAKIKTNKKLIVVASLIDKVPNLAGLCRTCEFFKVQKLMLHNASIVKDFQFQKISSTANKWMNIGELKKGDILKYLMRKKKKYAIVGLEQTKCSVPLKRFAFPERTILILGDEKEGLPSSVLLLLHHCVEIPGKGIIRSLNVHVSAAVTIYEYCRQHL
ncbi:rRNA (adenosine-2'-O-)-methyltransferase, putative [Plasmodium vivax]|uniref:rRNA (Adenosine-2'-O-)-methyltransferase, putative n=1 Tax=Plasmodium vivax TaxID=5855 RepID=A0A565A2G5_PLAVI|nr:rRNA (adenosine-2'-O-)-methyltransferase, putative [Plasmodium vivax]